MGKSVSTLDAASAAVKGTSEADSSTFTSLALILSLVTDASRSSFLQEFESSRKRRVVRCERRNLYSAEKRAKTAPERRDFNETNARSASRVAFLRSAKGSRPSRATLDR